MRDYCASSSIAFTRCRPYRKNDQAWVEQKNGSIVRRLVGYRRFEGLAAAAALADLYAAARLFLNFFQPSAKLAEKHRDGARVLISAIMRRQRRVSGYSTIRGPLTLPERACARFLPNSTLCYCSGI